MIHHELPDIVVPYKRHCTETEEKVIAGDVGEVYCEESTMRRIRAWWSACRLYFESVLASLRKKYGNVFSTECAPREMIYAVANAHLWIHTRSAFLSGKRSHMLMLYLLRNEENSMTELRKPEEIAVNRHKIIAPIIAAVEEKADAAKLALLKKEACELNGIHRRTLMRWVDAYRGHGFEGLKPVGSGKSVTGGIPEELLAEAILLRREVPGRSIPQIIEILEMEGKAPPGLLKRTTLQDRLQERG